MAHTRHAHGAHTVCTWRTHGTHMAHTRYAHGAHTLTLSVPTTCIICFTIFFIFCATHLNLQTYANYLNLRVRYYVLSAEMVFKSLKQCVHDNETRNEMAYMLSCLLLLGGSLQLRICYELRILLISIFLPNTFLF